MTRSDTRPALTDTIAATVRALVRARESRQLAIDGAPVLPDADAAYAVQAGVAAALGSFKGDGPGTWKSGGRSRADVLTHARLPDAGVWPSPADARSWPFHLRGIEAEVALRLGHDVDADRAATLDHVGATALVDAMCVSIEIVDSRWAEGLDAPALARLADLQSHGALVLGAWVPFALRDWAAQICRVTVGTRATIERIGTHPMADPAFVLPAWLRHVTRAGRVAPAGSVVTTGSWCGILHAAAGDRVRVEFPAIGSAEVRL